MAKYKEIVFAGHFALGEKTTEAQKETIAEALKKNEKLGIVINDIGFRKRLWYYALYGEQQLVLRCSKPSCSMSRSKIATQLEIDVKAYNEARETLNKHFGLNDLGISEFPRSDDQNYRSLVRSEIVPSLIKRRLREYEVDIPSENIFLETTLRNVASMRLKNSRSTGTKTWVPQIQRLGIEHLVRSDDTLSPTCGAIMLALYEKVNEKGYNQITQYYPKPDEPAIENARALCTALHKMFPEDPRWNLTFQNKYF